MGCRADVPSFKTLRGTRYSRSGSGRCPLMPIPRRRQSRVRVPGAAGRSALNFVLACFGLRRPVARLVLGGSGGDEKYRGFNRVTFTRRQRHMAMSP
jgi:hypothetical protein